MNEQKKVAVVILSWNGKKFLEQFLPSVIQHTASELCEIIVADNCSTDDSVSFLKNNYPSVRIIHNTKNINYYLIKVKFPGDYYNRCILKKNKNTPPVYIEYKPLYKQKWQTRIRIVTPKGPSCV